MSGDAAPLALPLSRLSTGACEATTLYRELRKPLLRYLVCLGLSSDEAQDVVQDAFLSLHRHLASGGSQENIRGWLFRVAHNQARNRQNRYDRNFSAASDAEMDARLARGHAGTRCAGEGEIPAVGKGDSPVDRVRTGVPASARQRIALPRNWRSFGNCDLYRERHGGSRHQKISGEMQCVNFREN